MGDRILNRSPSGTIMPPDICMIRTNDVFPLGPKVGGVNVDIEWFSAHSGLADLDVYVLIYDENVS